MSLAQTHTVDEAARIEKRFEEEKTVAVKTRGLLTSVCRSELLECRSWLAHDPNLLKNEVNRCRMLIQRSSFRGSNAVEKQRIAKSSIDKSKRTLPFEVRRRKSGCRKKNATDVLGSALYQWAIDNLHMGIRFNSAELLRQANVIANDLRVQHEAMIESGEKEAGCQLRLPRLHGRAGDTWCSRFVFRKNLSYRMTNLEFKVSKSTQEARMKTFLERVLHIRWLHYYLHGEQQTLSFSNSDEKPMMMIAAATKKTRAKKGKRSRVWVKEPHSKTRERYTIKTRVTYPQAPNDGKTVGIMFKGEGAQMRKKLEVPNDALLQFGPCGVLSHGHKPSILQMDRPQM